MDKKDKPNVREMALCNGMDYPSNVELVMMLIGSGTQKKPVECLAEEVLRVVESSNPPELIDRLLKIDGIGMTKALTIAAALELGRRQNRNPQAVLNKPSDCVPFVQHYAMKSSEHFLCVNLNGSREIISIRIICVGASNMAVVSPREVFYTTIKENASAVVLCHNHPSGVCAPSNQDLLMTKELVQVAIALGIAVLDHIILTRNGYYSLLEHNQLPTFS